MVVRILKQKDYGYEQFSITEPYIDYWLRYPHIYSYYLSPIMSGNHGS